MIPPDGQPILSAAAMRAAESRAIAAGSSVGTLMERAGAGVAEAVRRLAAGSPVLVLCGPGNNGGDGYVAARMLSANGVAVRVAALGAPRSEAAMAARGGWTGPVELIPPEEAHGPVVVDAVFGTGLSRPLDADPAEAMHGLIGRARLSVAVDLPSGVETDTGAELNPSRIPDYTLTLALGALKPAHVLHPSAARCGAVRVVDLGLDVMARGDPPDRTLERPTLPAPTPLMHKYSRGLVLVIGGAMPGAAALAALAAMHVGAGYTMLLGEAPDMPHALVQRPWSHETLTATLDGKKRRTTALLVGPGLGKGDEAAEKLVAALDSGYPLVIDGDALHLLDDPAFETIKARPPERPVVLTPHAGEFKALFGDYTGSKIEAARAASRRSGAVVVFKGPDTVVAYPDGRTRTTTASSAWLSTAGTGDVLAGTIATMLAGGHETAAEAGVWLHAEAARRLGGAFLADDLARELSVVRASL